jgi:hypothetical protein
MEDLIIAEKDGNVYNFYWKENKVHLGYAYQEVDGYYVFVPVGTGSWPGYGLEMVANKLEELNKDWDKQLMRLEYKWSVSFKFIRELCDMYIGAYWDKRRRWLYVFPLPCFGVIIKFH